MVWISDAINLYARTDDHATDQNCTSVPEIVANRAALREGCSVSRLQHVLFLSFNNRELAFEHIHEFIFGFVPMFDR